MCFEGGLKLFFRLRRWCHGGGSLFQHQFSVGINFVKTQISPLFHFCFSYKQFNANWRKANQQKKEQAYRFQASTENANIADVNIDIKEEKSGVAKDKR